MGDFHSPMRCISPNARILTPKPQVQQTLHHQQTQTQAKSSITWFAINGSLLGILLFDIIQTGSEYKPFLWLEWFFALIFGLNALYHIICYFMATLSLHPISLNAKQKKLLGVKENDPIFKSDLTPKCSTSASINLPSLHLSQSKNYSASPFSKYNDQASPKSLNMTPNASFNKSLNTSMNGSLTGEGMIQDEAQLQNYLLKTTEKERKINLSNNLDQPSNLLSSFWSHPATRNPGEVSPMLRRCAYQLAQTVDKSKSTSSGVEERTSPRGFFGTSDIWRKYRIDSGKVNQWTANLRMWISKTVVERVASEIDNVCSTVMRHGLSDCQPGHVGLDRLRKIAQSQSLVVPTLPTLVQFLELTNNQDYLVKRIKILAKGGSMSEFKWNNGGAYNGKPWDSSLPTDTAIIMHLVSTYMDTQLEAPLDQPDARPFSSRYMAKNSKELPRTKGPIIVSQSTDPFHYGLAIVGDSLPVDYEEIPRGHNNLFHTLLLFLYIVKMRNQGMLGRVNLGKSGVNVLWVIDGGQ